MIQIKKPLLAGLAACTVFSALAPAASVRVRMAEEPTHEISSLLFGQFLERLPERNPEKGPQAALVPGTHQLQPGAMDEMAKLNASIIRFPGGMVVSTLYDWTKLIDGSPFRPDPARPEDYEFGLHEFMSLCDQLQAEPLLVVNFRAAAWGTRPNEIPISPEEFAAAMVAYCNLPVGAPLPEGMYDWPALRAANGHPEPMGVRYFQIGNEWVVWIHAINRVREILGHEPLPDDAALTNHLAERLLDVIKAMRAVDPDIQIIIDAAIFENAHDKQDQENWLRAVLQDERVRDAADLAAVHIYTPSGVEYFAKNGEPVDADQLSPEDLWYAVVAAPSIDEQGLSILDNTSWRLARSLDWPVAMTEWNWNGWRVERHGASIWPRTIGAAGFLHAILREAEHIHLANQSMMIGNSWIINAVRVDPKGVQPPFILPAGRVTGLYAEHSGDRFLPLELEGLPTRPQPVTVGQLVAVPKVALIDAVATEDDAAVYLHFINRDKDKAHVVEIESANRQFAPEAQLFRMTGNDWDPQSQLFVSPGQFEENNEALAVPEGTFPVTLPAASITIVKLLKR